MVLHEQQNIAIETTCRAERIARLNDQLRQVGVGGRVVVTRGVSSLPGFEVTSLLSALREYDAFDAENDPHGERDFGDIEYCGASVFFKIDYYSPDLHWASEDPVEPSLTLRVLTVMLVDEY